jgi:hypothetical protein
MIHREMARPQQPERNGFRSNPHLVSKWTILERDGFGLNRHRALDIWWSMIFSENRYPLFRIML